MASNGTINAFTFSLPTSGTLSRNFSVSAEDGLPPPVVLIPKRPNPGVDQGFRPEMEHIVSKLELGDVVHKFFVGKSSRPDRRSLRVKRETRQVVWLRFMAEKNVVDGAVDLREIKEIRIGKDSKEFERWSDEASKFDHSRCLVVFYGHAFRLKTMSIATMNDQACQLWISGLKYLAEDTVTAPYPVQVDRWLWKKFYSLLRSDTGDNRRSTVTLKEVKNWFPTVGYKISSSRLREFCLELGFDERSNLSFDEFTSLVRKLIYEGDVFRLHFSTFSSEEGKVTFQDFRRFLSQEQQDPVAENTSMLCAVLHHYLQNPSRHVQQPYLTHQEFLDYLFSKENSVWDPQHDEINQDMDRPVSQYWIASSHNTYLTGDQWNSESSVEAYARCLLQGCRCIELDCWDGPDGMPFIYHGHTLTTKIKFIDVIQTIKKYAFIKSEYPVILSIEDHCTLPQQRKMAAAFVEVFGNELLTRPVDRNEESLPTPSALKKKIIIKHKKLKIPDGPLAVEEPTTPSLSRQDESLGDLDLSNFDKNGILYMEDMIEHGRWVPHFFALNEHVMHYTEVQQESHDGDDDEDDAESSISREGVPNEELHLMEKWFHGRIIRSEAESLVLQHAHLGDGAFLVRNSENFIGDHTLCFLRQGKVYHCHVRTKQERGHATYCIYDAVPFPSLYNLVEYYKTHDIRNPQFRIQLTHAVPQANRHENKKWFHSQLSRAQAEEMLRQVPMDGAYLVRHSDREPNWFAISFRAEGQIKHCRIKQEGRLYVIGTAQFDSLVELIVYYEKHPLYRRVKLRYPVNSEIVNNRFSRRRIDGDESAPYMDPSNFSTVTVKAIYNYDAQKIDELSFPRGAIITNVVKEDEGWWKGDYGGKRQHYFPANHTIEIAPPEPEESAPLGSLQKGCINIGGATVNLQPYLSNTVAANGFANHSHPRIEWIIRIEPLSTTGNTRCYDLGVPNKEEALEWVNKIRELAQSASYRETQNKKVEKASGIAKELSDLIVYCRSVTFHVEKLKSENKCIYEMCSFPETKGEKLLLSQEYCKEFLSYHKDMFSRVYPKGQRIDSSNYNPVPFWNVGVQMVALNYQTPGKQMEINQGRFMQNGGCGYVLRPECMMDEGFNPNDPSTLKGVDALTITIRVISARHLSKRKGIASPYVEVELIGAEYDCNIRYTTKHVADNGLKPVWNEVCVLQVICPPLALLRFVVYDVDMFGDPNCIAQATYPVTCLRGGYRSVPLKNGYSEELELASLLVHMDIQKTINETEASHKRREHALNTYKRMSLETSSTPQIAAHRTSLG